MKVGIVVPFSWTFWGGVLEHATLQAEALVQLGHDARILGGYDPPDRRTRFIHRGVMNSELPPQHYLSLGRTVMVPANRSVARLVLNPAIVSRLKSYLRDEQFDALHLHEPMTPSVCVAALAVADVPVAATWHAAGGLGWMHTGLPFWGCLIDRVDACFAVSPAARDSAQRWLPHLAFDIVPNGVSVSEQVRFDNRRHAVLFIGRADRRKGLPVLLRAWGDVHSQTGAELRIIGADSGVVRRLAEREDLPDAAVVSLGFVSRTRRAEEIREAKVLAAPATGHESFGMVILEAFAGGAAVVASDIPGYRPVVGNAGILVPREDPKALAAAIIQLLVCEEERVRLAGLGWRRALMHYSWRPIAETLVAAYTRLL